MTSAHHAHSAVLWTGDQRVPLLKRALEMASIRVVGVGTPQRGRTAELAAAFDAEPLSDVRAALVTAQADVFILADPGVLATEPTEADAGALRACAARGARVVSLEPMPASLLSLSILARTGEGGLSGHLPRFVPLLRRRGWIRDAIDASIAEGPVRCLSLEVVAGRECGTLSARIFDAVDLIVGVMGEPERADAAYVNAESHPSLRAMPGESLSGMSGVLTAHFRYVDGRSAALLVSDQSAAGAPLVRGLTMLTAQSWHMARNGAGGVYPLGAARHEAMTGSANADPAAELAEDLASALDGGTPSVQPTDVVGVLATAGAALLSARTGESESPGTLVRMAATP